MELGDNNDEVENKGTDTKKVISVPRCAVLSQTTLKVSGDIPGAVAGGALFSVGDMFRYLLIGGIAEGSFGPSSIRLLDIRTMKWTSVPEEQDIYSLCYKTCRRFSHSVVQTSDRIGGFGLLFGGFEPSEGSEAQVPAFADTWSPIKATASLSLVKVRVDGDKCRFETVDTINAGPCARGYHASCAFPVDGSDRDHILIHGGSKTISSAGSDPIDDCWMLDDKNQWFKIEQTGASTADHLVGHSIIYWPSRKSLLLIGGDYHKGPVPTRPLIGTLKFQGSGRLIEIVWSPLRLRGSPPMARSFHSMMWISEDRGIIWGGMTQSLVSDVILIQPEENSSNKESIWLKPVYESNVTLRASAMAAMAGKVVGFGGCDNDGVFGSGNVKAKSELFLGTSFGLRQQTKGSMSVKNNKGYVFKLITVGESGVGKTCLIRRFVDDIYNETHLATISTDLLVLRTMIQGKLTTLQLWDTAGQERFAHLTTNYVRDAEGFLVVYDATRRESFERVQFWLDWLIDNRSSEAIRGDTLLIGNKYDLESEVVVTEDEARRYARRAGIDFIATSARSSLNVDIAFMSICRELVKTRETSIKQGNHEGMSMDNAISINAISEPLNRELNGCLSLFM